MNPIPASGMQRAISSGVRSMRTPSAPSTSAAPDRDESARLPCFATGTPHPAAKALYFTVKNLDAAFARAQALGCLSHTG